MAGHGGVLNMKRERAQGAFTLTEVLIAAVIGAVVAWGTASAFLAAARLLRAQDNSALAEAASYAQQTLERKRNHIACAAPWFDPTTCAPAAGMPTKWTDDPFVDAGGTPYAGGTESILNPPGAQRRYCVTSADCDGGGPGDCFKVEVRVCWDGTACPAAGDACP